MKWLKRKTIVYFNLAGADVTVNINTDNDFRLKSLVVAENEESRLLTFDVSSSFGQDIITISAKSSAAATSAKSSAAATSAKSSAAATTTKKFSLTIFLCGEDVKFNGKAKSLTIYQPSNTNLSASMDCKSLSVLPVNAPKKERKNHSKAPEG